MRWAGSWRTSRSVPVRERTEGSGESRLKGMELLGVLAWVCFTVAVEQPPGNLRGLKWKDIPWFCGLAGLHAVLPGNACPAASSWWRAGLGGPGNPLSLLWGLGVGWGHLGSSPCALSLPHGVTSPRASLIAAKPLPCKAILRPKRWKWQLVLHSVRPGCGWPTCTSPLGWAGLQWWG